MNFKKLTDLNVANKTVLIRVDMNVPMKAGKVADDTRIRASLPSIEYCLNNGAAVIAMTHLGRPTEGEFHPEDDITPIAEYVGQLLGKKVSVINDISHRPALAAGDIAMLQNVRINKGEKKNVDELGKQYAALGDIFVCDAFGTAHRAQASTHAAAKFAPVACAGLLLAEELDALAQALENPKRPMIAIVGGSKVSTKLTVLETLADKVDGLIVGGGIANTFLAAKGFNVGKSLAEHDLVADARRIIDKIEAKGGQVPLPVDVIVAREFSENATAVAKKISEVSDDDMILDIGEQSAAALDEILQNAGTIVWNGPVGVFEFDQFANGTKALSHSIANSNAFSIAGGGDTLAAVAKFGVTEKINYVSTGGGAFLEFLEGKALPAVAILEERFQD
ncbi:MAG: phosphoglycerate kinase [Neisseriaceae bacterium]|nr:phosphoglycerate kinase [Neisseriaceae bacterium]